MPATDLRPPGVKARTGRPDLLRVRSGDYRVTYAIHHDELTVLVLALGHRREIYRDSQPNRPPGTATRVELPLRPGEHLRMHGQARKPRLPRTGDHAGPASASERPGQTAWMRFSALTGTFHPPGLAARGHRPPRRACG
jgi:ParE toxin of type II toxin-antitoxin system, parDE